MRKSRLNWTVGMWIYGYKSKSEFDGEFQKSG